MSPLSLLRDTPRAGPEQFATFMASVHDAEVALAMGTSLAQEYLLAV